MVTAFVFGVAAATSGCSGMEVGGRLGVYRVDERQDSSRTHREAVPWKCYFVPCTTTTAGEAQGS
jgi:hypothetical protein